MWKTKPKNSIDLCIMFIFLIIITSCSNQNNRQFETYKSFDIYNLKGLKKLNQTFFISKPYFKLSSSEDSLVLIAKGNESVTSEIFTLMENNVWHSVKKIASGTKGKLIINSESHHKFVYNDTILIYSTYGVGRKLDYDYAFSIIEINTKHKNLKFYYPNFNERKEKINFSDIDSIQNNSPIYREEIKTFVGQNLYMDITEKDELTNSIEQFTLFHKLNGASEYFINVDNCHNYEIQKLKYKERVELD